MINRLSTIIKPNTRYTLNKFMSIEDRLKRYNGDDWEKYVSPKYITYNDYNDYNKFLVPIDSSLNMYIIEWLKHSGTAIHGHSYPGCVYKVLDGYLKESIYSSDQYTYNNKLLCENILNKGDVKYINNKIGLHRIKNTSDNKCYTLNIYPK